LPVEFRLALAAGAALVGAWVLTPLAIRLAERTGFHDRPDSGYKKHGRATPYLGGVALIGAFLLASVVWPSVIERVWPIMAGAVAMWMLGTTDDRITVRPALRVIAEVALGVMLYGLDRGWSVSGSGVVDLLLTVVWVVAVVNAVNLMDNMDGASSTVGLLAALGIGAAALVGNDEAMAVAAFALAGACAGFLRFNLAGPARIFLGDGGSMPLGFLIAAMTMSVHWPADVGWAAVPGGALLVGLPVLDTALVIVSRRRRGVSFLTGGRDHLTHRLAGRLGSPRRVAAILALGQAGLAAAAVAAGASGRSPLLVTGGVCLLAAAAAVLVLESEDWRTDTPRAVAADSRSVSAVASR
jgi:UDP-GlcNAc:undecaprenyl-phosphate GlcNAc-1-phosphate transferase